MYNYDRSKTAALQPTVEGFLMILRGNLVQSDQAQEKRDLKRGTPPNPYALGHMMEALNKVRSQVASIKDSSDPADLEKLKVAINRQFHDVAPIRKTLKAIDNYLRTGKAPKYPTGGGQPIWKAAATVNYKPIEKYSDALTALQEQFVGGVGMKTAEYINTTNRRLRRHGEWTWGSPQGRGVGTYSINVYNQMQGAEQPTAMTIYFKFDNAIEVYAKTETGDNLFKKKVDFGKSASGVALDIGSGWEKLTTGTVDYGY